MGVDRVLSTRARMGNALRLAPKWHGGTLGIASAPTQALPSSGLDDYETCKLSPYDAPS